MTAVSSECSAPLRLHPFGPAASAASTSARLVMLFDPGTRTVAAGGLVSGAISIRSGYVTGLSLIGHAHQEQPRRRGRRAGQLSLARFQNLRDLRLGPVAAADVHQRPGDGPHHIVQEAV